MIKRKWTIALILIATVCVVSIYFVITRVTRDAGIATVESMGGAVRIERVSSVFQLFPLPVCWVEFKQTDFNDMELDKLILALQRIAVRDTRIDLGETALTEVQIGRIMREVGGDIHLNLRRPARAHPQIKPETNRSN